jgi:diacylglycerol O-acyltransferase
MTVLMDPSEDAGITTAPPWLPQPEPTATQLLFDALSESARGPWHQLIAIGRAAAAPAQTVHRLAATAKGMRSFAERLMKRTTPLSIEGAIGRQRRWAVGRCSLADAKLIRSVFGGSVNDVVLTAITSAFHDLLIERGDLIDGATLTSLVPVSIRLPTDHDLNNRVSMMLAELPVGLSDPLERFQAVLQQMVDVKASQEAIAGTAVFEAADLLPPAFFALLARATMSILRQTPQRAVNTVTTNVPGPQLRLFAIGREMLEYLPYVPITAGVRIGVAILSYNGQISFGVTGDYDSTPDIHTMAEGIEAAVAELTELAAHERRASTDRSAIQHRQSPGRSRATP